MDDFYNSIKDNLENRPEPGFRENAWNALQQQMGGQEPEESSRGKYLWGLFSLLIAGTFLMNLGMYHSMKASLKDGFVSKNTIAQTDTVFETKVIYQTDTVYQTIVEERIVYKYRSSNPEGENPVGAISQSSVISPSVVSTTSNHSNITEAPKISAHSGLANKSNPGNTDFLTGKNTTQTFDIESVIADGPIDSHRNNVAETAAAKVISGQDKRVSPKQEKPWAEIFGIPVSYSLLETAARRDMPVVDVVHVRKQQMFRHQLNQLKPEGFILDGHASYLFPFHEDLNDQSGYGFGLTAELVFTAQLRLFADIDYQQMKYSLDAMDETLGVPVIPAPDVDYLFQKAVVKRPDYQYAFGLKYLFNTRRNFQPYLGVGYSITTMLPYEVLYEYENDDLEITLEKKTEDRVTIGDQLLVKAGMELAFRKHWRYHVGGFYRFQFDDEETVVPNILGLKTGIAYHF